MNDEKPGLAPDTKALVEKVSTWIGISILCWGILLGITVVTIKVIQSL